VSGYAKFAVAIALLAAGGEVALAWATAEAWAPEGTPLLLAFLAGPLAFLALVAWRRRDHPARSKLLFRLTTVLAALGLGVLTFDFVRFRNEPPGRHVPHAHPLILPLVQWLAVLAVWITLVIKEGREKRAKPAEQATAK
jgi:hypothetical protein